MSDNNNKRGRKTAREAKEQGHKLAQQALAEETGVKEPAVTTPRTTVQKPTVRRPIVQRPQPGSASTQRLIFAQADDWKGAAEFFSTMAHTPFPEVLEKGGLVDIIGDFVPGEIIRVEVIPSQEPKGEPKIHFDSGYKVKGNLPDDWLLLSKTPDWFQKRWAHRQVVVDALEGDITPWNDGIATKVLLGVIEEEIRIRMYFLSLRHKMTNGQTVQASFGITILIKPKEKTAIYEKVLDPENKFGVREGQMVSLGRLTQSSLDPVPHLFKAWAKMESNCPEVQRILREHQRSNAPNAAK